MGNTKKKLRSGDIFTVPLFLPSYQEWREEYDEFIDYRKYQFPKDDLYAYGRLIELQAGNMNLIELFSYVGQIPQSPEVITHSGRLFEPVMMVGAFARGRWRFLFDGPNYDKWADSDYGNISFLMGCHMSMWRGGEQIGITRRQADALEQSGVPDMIVHGSVELEEKIRSLLAERGVELNYGQTVEGRRDGYPQPRDLDRKLKEAIAPFQWSSDSGRYSLCLHIGEWNRDSFEKNHMLGNGYDWEKAASAFLETYMPHLKGKFTFDSEADTFSMQSRLKKTLKEFALAFHKVALDTNAFEELLRQDIEFPGG